MARNLKRQFPINVLIALLFFIAAIAALNGEKQRMSLRILGMQAQVKADQETMKKPFGHSGKQWSN